MYPSQTVGDDPIKCFHHLESLAKYYLCLRMVYFSRFLVFLPGGRRIMSCLCQRPSLSFRTHFLNRPLLLMPCFSKGRNFACFFYMNFAIFVPNVFLSISNCCWQYSLWFSTTVSQPPTRSLTGHEGFRVRTVLMSSVKCIFHYLFLTITLNLYSFYFCM